MRNGVLLLLLFASSANADRAIFDEACDILEEVVGEYLCEDVRMPSLIEIRGNENMGNYDAWNVRVILRMGLEPNTRSRVLAHEYAHHILHVTGVAPATETMAEVCLSEEYAHELSHIYGKRYNHILAPGEVSWRERYPECNWEVDSDA